MIDGQCALCRRTANVLHRLDWFDRLSFADANDAAARETIAPGVTADEALAEMYVRQGPNRLETGLDGYILLARSLPLLAPLAALASLPVLHAVGTRIYKAVTLRRARTTACDGAACRVHNARPVTNRG
jgi:predicted DCC family thiol-disulfide oxidoreductase YuxK